MNNSSKPRPPALAVWWLQHACPSRDKDALTGDLIERFREGQTSGWFWRQVFIAFIVGVLSGIRRHWPAFAYAISAWKMGPYFWSGNGPGSLPRLLHWSVLPWPWSQMVVELSPSVLLVLSALPVLAIGLLIERSFRWVSLLRTAAINLALITFGHYSIDIFPWLLRPVPGDNNHKALIFPLIVPTVLFFSTFLAAAWVGCRVRSSVERAERSL